MLTFTRSKGCPKCPDRRAKHPPRIPAAESFCLLPIVADLSTAEMPAGVVAPKHTLIAEFEVKAGIL